VLTQDRWVTISPEFARVLLRGVLHFRIIREKIGELVSQRSFLDFSRWILGQFIQENHACGYFEFRYVVDQVPL
jgi:hypothetical protein